MITIRIGYDEGGHSTAWGAEDGQGREVFGYSPGLPKATGHDYGIAPWDWFRMARRVVRIGKVRIMWSKAQYSGRRDGIVISVPVQEMRK